MHCDTYRNGSQSLLNLLLLPCVSSWSLRCISEAAMISSGPASDSSSDAFVDSDDVEPYVGRGLDGLARICCSSSSSSCPFLHRTFAAICLSAARAMLLRVSCGRSYEAESTRSGKKKIFLEIQYSFGRKRRTKARTKFWGRQEQPGRFHEDRIDGSCIYLCIAPSGLPGADQVACTYTHAGVRS